PQRGWPPPPSTRMSCGLPRWSRSGPGSTAGPIRPPGWPRPARSPCSSPGTVPAGLALAAGLWAWRNYAITTGLAGITAAAPITFDKRQWEHQVRTAKGLTGAPGAVPLLAKGGKIPVGGTIRAVGHHWDPVFALPHSALARHMVIVGATGSGKTNLMIRLWAGWFTATLAVAWAGH